MAALQTIRSKGGILVSIIIGLALAAFIVGDALSSGASVFNRSRNQVGEVAGERIGVQEFQNKVTKNEEIVKMMNGLSALNDEQQTTLRENTWQQMVMEIVMNREYEALGIDVTGDELYDLLLGDNVSPIIRRMFTDPNTGEFDVNQARTTIKNLLESTGNTQQKAYWLNIEEQVADSRKQAKYNALLAKAIYATDAQAEESVKGSNVKADISYIVKNYTAISDSTVTVSNSEIKSYYETMKKRFEQPETRRIIYVNFDIDPSSEDYSETEKWSNDLVAEFAEAQNPAEFVSMTSDKNFDAAYYKRGDITNDSLADFLFSKKEGVFGPYMENNSFRIARVADRRMLPDSVRARHILIAPQNNDYARAKAVADSLANVLKHGGDFEALARQYSTDQNSAVNGGDLGWFGQQMMVQPFSDTVFFANPREIKVVVTQFGAHVVQVTDRAKPVEKVQVATVEKEIVASQKTTNRIYNDAHNFANGVTDLESFNKKVEETGLTKRVASLNKNDKGVAGMENARELVRQCYLAENVNSVLVTNEGVNIFESDGKFTVAVVTEINEEGISPIQAVASTIRRELIRKKKAEMLAKELADATTGSESLLSVAQKVGLEVQEATEVTFNAFQIPGAGIEPKVIAAAVMTEQGKISAPIEGNQGVYVIMVNNRTEDEVTPELVAQAKGGMQQSNAYRTSYQAVQALMKNAEVTDTRYKFY